MVAALRTTTGFPISALTACRARTIMVAPFCRECGVQRRAIRQWLRTLAVVSVIGLAWVSQPALAAQALPMQLARFDAGPLPPDTAEILSGRFDNNFSELQARDLRIGPPGRTFWLRIDVQVPAPSESDIAEGHWLLVMNRVPVEVLEVYVPQAEGDWNSQRESFFRPGAQALTLGGGYFFRLPRDRADSLRVYVRLVTDVRVNLEPRILREGDSMAQDRALSNLFTAIYTAFVVLLVINLILYGALRDAAYLAFVAWGGALFVLILSANGHVYGIPGLGWLAWWGALGPYAFAFLASAASVWLFRALTESRNLIPRFDRAIGWYGWALLALAALCLANLRDWSPLLQLGVNGALAVTSLLLCAGSLLAWRAGSAMARAFFWVWSLLTVLVLLRVGVSFGLPSFGGLGLYGYQIGASAAAFLFSVALAGRVIEFRQQRDRAELQREQVDATLRLEQTRRAFVDNLRGLLAKSTTGDAEWVVLRRLLVDLTPLIPQCGSAVIVQSHDGMDFMFTEPAEEKDHFARLLQARVDALRGICRARTPMVVKLEEPGESAGGGRAGTFAVVPLPLARSGWGALLLERGELEDFTADELRTAQDFACVALETAQEVLSQASLRMEASSDPLTGALNRRAGDAALAAALKHAIGQRLPLTVLFLDLDHFKAVNDIHGHAVGDRCLTVLAETIAGQLDSGDSLSRYGGEEFQVVLPGRSLAQGRELAERIRIAVAQTRIDCNGLKLTLTVSIGVATRQAEDTTIQTLQERADKALYKAKRSGRNCVATLVPTDLSAPPIQGIY
jgi:diguanylate cyclase (GGDEF)-like protein